MCYLNIYLTEEFFIILKPGDFFSAYSIILSWPIFNILLAYDIALRLKLFCKYYFIF